MTKTLEVMMYWFMSNCHDKKTNKTKKLTGYDVLVNVKVS